ncbi:MAG: hypothetical protein M1820_007578 [Bogoriella megaspora]|nr:MAG: hypothetical protein M1820_007578 [Bogoriella megaspora]
MPGWFVSLLLQLVFVSGAGIWKCIFSLKDRVRRRLFPSYKAIKRMIEKSLSMSLENEAETTYSFKAKA